MSRHRDVRRYAVVLALAALLSCSDTKPLDFRADASAGFDAGVDPERVAACKRCMQEPNAPCRSAYDQCGPYPRCVELIECAVQSGCFQLPELAPRIDCVRPCLREAGVTTGSDPVVLQGLPVNACTLKAGPCGSECVPP